MSWAPTIAKSIRIKYTDLFMPPKMKCMYKTYEDFDNVRILGSNNFF